MDTQNNKVYITNSENSINQESDIDIEYVYLTIPQEYICIYHKLLVCLSDFGENAIKDCKAACEGTNLYVIQCWNMFQSALACRALGLLDKAELFIKYIKAQLDLIYKGTDSKQYCGTGIMPITEDGKLMAQVSCFDNRVEFYIDEETGRLYEELRNSGLNNVVHSVKNNHLIETYNGTDN